MRLFEEAKQRFLALKGSERVNSVFDAATEEGLRPTRSDIHLIIIGGHHSHGMRDRLFGDIGRTLAHGSKCPLLLMPSGPE